MQKNVFMYMHQNYSLSKLNTLRLISQADNFISLTSIDDLSDISNYINCVDYNSVGFNHAGSNCVSSNCVTAKCTDIEQRNFFVLGGGSNLILPEVYPGLVIHNQLKGIELLAQDDIYATVKVMAGEVWDDFVEYTLNNNWFGLENLSLIPGTVGAAPIQNIGAYGVEVKSFIDYVEVYDINSGQYLILNNEKCSFSYRNSIFKIMPNYIVIAVVFRLLKQEKLHTSYGDVAAQIAKIKHPTASDLRKVIIDIRSSKLPDPKLIGNVGSFFHNPILDIQTVDKLRVEFPKLPVYEVDAYHSKISAGWLIDNLGLKGYRVGNVGVYDKQALVLVNYDKATKTEILSFAQLIQDKIFATYKVKINIEPIIV